MAKLKRIGVLTGGGDAPGLNAVIRAVVKAGVNNGIEVVGLEDSFDGLIEPNRSRVMTAKDVTGILRRGGTILGTVNRGDPFAYPVETSEGKHDYSTRVVEMFHRMGLDALVVIGGDGTLAIAHKFSRMGIPIVGVPKTIDNDIVQTTNTFGFDTAVAFATDAIDRLAHDRGSAPPHHGCRGHGTQHRMDRPVRGRGRRRRRHPDSRKSRTTSSWWLSRSRIVTPGARISRSSSSPKDAKPVGGATSLIKSASIGRAERLGGVGHRIAANSRR